jgi:uncharacterized protein YbjQ (UPF0145 family)
MSQPPPGPYPPPGPQYPPAGQQYPPAGQYQPPGPYPPPGQQYPPPGPYSPGGQYPPSGQYPPPGPDPAAGQYAPPPEAFRVTTALQLQDMTIERELGLTFGLVVRSMGIAKVLGAGLTALRQGEVTQYTSLLEQSRRHAIDRMIDNARLLGANAIIAMRFDSSEVNQQLTEIVAYGTAVVVRPD